MKGQCFLYSYKYNDNKIFTSLEMKKKKCLRLCNKNTSLYTALGSKQQNFQQLPSDLSERTMFVVRKIRQFLSQSKRTDILDFPPPVRFCSLFEDPPLPPPPPPQLFTTNIPFE